MPTHRPSFTSEPKASTLLFLVLSRLSFGACICICCFYQARCIGSDLHIFFFMFSFISVL